MPHLTLEYTTNVTQEIETRDLFTQLHQVLARAAGIKTENCKSRAIRREDFFVGDGETKNAFVHLDIRFLEGRSPDLKQAVGRQSLGILEAHFAPTAAELALQITVEVQDIQRQTYFKVPEESLA